MRARSAQKLTDEMYARYPGMTIWGKGDLPHAQRVSDHNEDDTAGVRAAQSDSDNVPEHRAIDCPLDNVFTRAEAHRTIDDVLNGPHKEQNRIKTRYINFEDTQWHFLNNFEPRPNTDDPHPTHVHFSMQASQDENTSQWLPVITEGDDMFCNQDDPIGSGKVIVLQGNLNTVLKHMGITPLLVLDDDYGSKTAKAMLDTKVGNPENNGSMYWAGEELTLKDKLRAIAAEKAVAAHLSGNPHGAQEAFSFIIPAQEITVTPEEE